MFLRFLALIPIALCAATNVVGQVPTTGGSNSPSPTTSGTPNPSSVPSLENQPNSTATSPNAPRPVGKLELPTNAGQYWVEYDLRPYTQALKNVERPQQAIIDWITRETGTDVWFNEPTGILTADRTTLRVYHNAGMQKVVAQIYERFVNGNLEPQVYRLRLITINNPNWRSRALPLMRSAPVESAGVHGWLMPKENGAIFLAQMRERIDAKEVQAADLILVNGQSQSIDQLRSRNYLREYQKNTTAAWPPYTPVSDEIQEGYRLKFSPLLSLDGRSLDVMLKCDVDQVERLNSVQIDLPTLPQSQSVQIEVPQLVSWRLHERIRWPSDQILLLSCGVIANPSNTINHTLAGSPPSLFGLNRILPSSTGDRADALLMIEYKGSAATQINGSAPNPTTNPVPGAAFNNALTPNSRGRY